MGPRQASQLKGRPNGCCGIDSGACTAVEKIGRLKRKEIMYIQLTIIEKMKTFLSLGGVNDELARAN